MMPRSSLYAIASRRSKAAASAVDCTDMVRVEPAAVMTVEIDYSRYGSLEGYIRQRASVEIGRAHV